MPGSIASASNSERWLVVGVNWIGDAIMSMPALQAWRRAHPSARLTLLVKQPLAPLWRMHDAGNAVVTYEDRWAAMRHAAREIRTERVQRAVLFPNSFRSALVPFLARVPERIGRCGQWRRWLLTEPLLSAGDERMHQSLEYYDLLGLPRPAETVETPVLHLPGEARRTAEALLAKWPCPLLGIMPGAARGPAKRWPVAHFSAVAKRWVAERGGSVVAMGASSDAAAGEAIVHAAGSGVNLAGATSLVEWAACLQQCAAVLCNDSGGMHLASALGRPVVAVFGATDPRITGPLGPHARIVQDEGARSRAIDAADPAAEKRLAAILPDRVYPELMNLVGA